MFWKKDSTPEYLKDRELNSLLVVGDSCEGSDAFVSTCSIRLMDPEKSQLIVV